MALLKIFYSFLILTTLMKGNQPFFLKNLPNDDHRYFKSNKHTFLFYIKIVLFEGILIYEATLNPNCMHQCILHILVFFFISNRIISYKIVHMASSNLPERPPPFFKCMPIIMCFAGNLRYCFTPKVLDWTWSILYSGALFRHCNITMYFDDKYMQ